MPDQSRATERIASIEASAAGRPLLPIQSALVYALRSSDPELHRYVEDIDHASERSIRERWERVLEAAVFASENPVKSPTATLDMLVSARRDIATEMRDIVSRAGDARRSLSPSDEARLGELDARYDRVAGDEAHLRTVTRKLEPGDATHRRIMNSMYLRPAQEMGDVIREMIKNNETTRDFPAATSRAIRGMPDLLIDAEPGRLDNVDTSRAISDFANGSALYTSDFATRVALYQRTLSPYMRTATVIDADNGRPLVLPNLTGDPTVYSPGEGTAITASDPTLGSVTATPKSYKALTLISYESFEDAEYSITDAVARTHARSISMSFDTDATTALLAGASNGGTATGLGGGSTATFFGYEDLIDLRLGRAAPYRDHGAWFMSNGAVKKVRKYVDKNGDYLWQPSLMAGQPDTLEGHPVYEAPGLAAPGSATKSVVYGDPSTLVIKATALRVLIDYSRYLDTDQVAVRTVQRLALAVPDAAALAYLVSATS